MKKFVSIVLALALALSLATVAFATPLWEVGNTENKEVTLDTYNKTFNTKEADDVVFEFHKAVAPSKDNAYKGNIAFYTVKSVGDAAEGVDFAGKAFVLTETYNKDVTFAVKAHNEKVALGDVAANQTANDPVYYMTWVMAVDYANTAKQFTAWGDKCGQYKDPKVKDGFFVILNNVFADDAEQVWGTKAIADNAVYQNNVLVDGKVYTVEGQVTKTPHNWVVNTMDEDNKVLTYKCTVCGTVGTVVESAFCKEAQGHQLERLGNTLIAFDYTVGQAAADKTVDSSKTFDAGVAMYVGLSLASVAGSAVVIGKKKEF